VPAIPADVSLSTTATSFIATGQAQVGTPGRRPSAAARGRSTALESVSPTYPHSRTNSRSFFTTVQLPAFQPTT
jgi:hypothetical protein